MSRIAESHLGDKPYPDSPGFKERGTSRDAAMAARPAAADLRSRCLGAIARAGDAGMTADQVAAALAASVLGVRPRISELASLREIERTGERRPNASGIMAAVWRRTR